MTENRRLVPYDLVPPGHEMVYTGERASASDERIKEDPSLSVDADGNVIRKCSLFGLAGAGGTDEENACLDGIQATLGHLNDDTRRIRAQIAAIEQCDSGFALTVEELLDAIGRGELREPSCRPGCCWNEISWWSMRCTQPRQVEAMGAVQAILRGYLDGKPKAALTGEYPYANGFIERTYEWLGPRTGLAEHQKLMLERVLLPFELWTKQSRTGERATREGETTDALCAEDMELIGELYEDLFEREDGRGRQLDAQIARAAGLPPIHNMFDKRSREALEGISDQAKADLYRVCARIAEGVPNVCDCNLPTFRRIENWIHGIGTGKLTIPTHKPGALRDWLNRVVFGYALAFDKWLLRVPMQFLLLDLGHVDLGFDPRSDVLRVYASLGKENPVKEWLAASLWLALYGNGKRPTFTRALELGVSARGWMDEQLRPSAIDGGGIPEA